MKKKSKKKYSYWCINEDTGKEYHFLSNEEYHLGAEIVDDFGREFLIYDYDKNEQ